MNFSDLEGAILKTLSYFDIFNFPLKEGELFLYLFDVKSNRNLFKRELKNLMKKGFIEFEDSYYFLRGRKNIVKIRKMGEKRAKMLLKRAKTIIRIISFFPFIKSIMISGDVSRGVAARESDVDYFIISERGRVWVLKFFLMLFKRIFLLNSYKLLCPNYIISEDHLEINEKNYFIACEIAGLLPVYNFEYYELFIKKNKWVKEFLPNFNFNRNNSIPNRKPFKKPFIRKFFEKMLSGGLGDKMEKISLLTFRRFYEKKFDNNKRIREIVLKGITPFHAKIQPRDAFEIVDREFKKRLKRFNIPYE